MFISLVPNWSTENKIFTSKDGFSMSAFFQAIKKFFQAICLRLQVTGENLQELSMMFTQSRTAFMVKHFPHWKKKTILFGIPVKKTKPWQSFSDFFEKDRWNQLLGQICIMGFVVWIISSGNLICSCIDSRLGRFFLSCH